jgi:hypothetical protein
MTGRWEEELRAEYSDTERKLATPLDISVDYDIVENDGTIPGEGDTATLVQLFQSITTNPMLANQFDVVRIFQKIARMSGVKDISDFRNKQLPAVSSAVVPDQVVQNEAQKGNLVPIG